MIQRIGLWNTAFLGDAVLTLPLIQALANAYPTAELDFYVRPGLSSLFLEHPNIANVYSYKKNIPTAYFLKTALALKNYSLWINAHRGIRSGLFSFFSKAPIRIGYRETPLSSIWYTDRVDREFGKKNEIERLLNLLLPLSITATDSCPKIYLPNDALEEADLFKNKCGGPILGIHPGSAWGTKRWPIEYFAYIGKKALECGAHVIIFAGKEEKEIATQTYIKINSSIADKAKERLHDMSGKLSLIQLAAYISRLTCYLTNDSGPMHLAWAQKIPVTALFGPTVRSHGFFPRGNSSTVFEIDIPCRPCGLHGPHVCPKGHHDCMVKLVPEMVWPDVATKLQC